MPDFEEIKKTTTGSKLLPIPAPALGNNPIPDNANIPTTDALHPKKREDFELGNQSKLAESSAPDQYADFPPVNETDELKDKDIGNYINNDTYNLAISKIDIKNVKNIAFEKIGNKELYPRGQGTVNDDNLTKLFPRDEPCLDDIKQYDFGDRCFLAAITSMIDKDPSAIKNMIRDNGDGTATVRLYNRNGEAEYYTVDISSAITKEAYDEYKSSKENAGGVMDKSFNVFMKEAGKSPYEFRSQIASPALWLEVLRKAYMYFRTKHVGDDGEYFKEYLKRELECAKYIDLAYSIRGLQEKICNDLNNSEDFFKLRGYLMQKTIESVYGSLKDDKEPTNTDTYNRLCLFVAVARELYELDESKRKINPKRVKLREESLQVYLSTLHINNATQINYEELAKLILEKSTSAKEVLDNLIAPLKDVVGEEYLNEIGIMKILPDKLHKAYYGIKYGILQEAENTVLEFFLGKYGSFPKKEDTNILKDEEIAGFVSNVNKKTHENFVFEKIGNKELYPEGKKVKDDNLTELFPHKPCLDDIKQGRLEDCYFLAAITSMINKNPSEIENMIRDNGDGTATVRLYRYNSKTKNTEVEYYTVDISSAITEKAYNEYIKWREKDDNTNKSFDEFKSEEMKNKSPYIFNGNTYPVLWLEVLRKAYMYHRINHIGTYKNKKKQLEYAKGVDIAEFLPHLSEKINDSKKRGESTFARIQRHLMNKIMDDFVEFLANSGTSSKHNNNPKDYKELYDAMQEARKFYYPDKSKESEEKVISEGIKKFKKFVEQYSHDKSSPIRRVINYNTDWQQNYNENQNKINDYCSRYADQVKKKLSDLIEPIKDAVGEKYLNKIGIMKIISDEPLHKAYYGIANRGYGWQTFQYLFSGGVMYLCNDLSTTEKGFDSQLKEYEKELEEKEDNKLKQTSTKTHLKRKFPLSKDRDYDNKMLTIYNDIKNILSAGEIIFATFNTKRFKTSGTSSERGLHKGLYSGHLYSILGVGEKVFPKIDGGSKTIKTIIIRNPHGRTGRQYKATKADGTLIDDIFENFETLDSLTDFSSVHAVDTDKTFGNFSTPRTFRDLATEKDITGSGIFEMELSDFVYHFEWEHFDM